METISFGAEAEKLSSSRKQHQPQQLEIVDDYYSVEAPPKQVPSSSKSTTRAAAATEATVRSFLEKGAKLNIVDDYLDFSNKTPQSSKSLLDESGIIRDEQDEA